MCRDPEIMNDEGNEIKRNVIVYKIPDDIFLNSIKTNGIQKEHSHIRETYGNTTKYLYQYMVTIFLFKG